MPTYGTKLLRTCLLTALWGYSLVGFAKGSCPDDDGALKRLGTTQYYIIYTETGEKELTDWAGAQAKCKAVGMDLAVIDSYGADAAAGRALEEKLGKQDHLYNGRRPLFWIGAKYILNSQAYVWQTGGKDTVLNYNNILYDGTRAIGYGQDLSDDGNFWKPTERLADRCLAYGITLNVSASILYDDKCPGGFETRMVELPCDDKHRYTMCEAKDDCTDDQTKNDTVFTSAKEYYMTEGNWIFGNPRRFIVNWKPRMKHEADAYCKERGMSLYHPTKTDGCLIPYLALWNRRITTANFWTGIEYFIGMNMFLFPDGEKVRDDKKPYTYANVTDPRRLKSPGPGAVGSNEMIGVCVVAAYSYEPKHDSSCSYCRWNSMTVIPANCGVKVATICSRLDEHSKVLGSCGNYWGEGNDVYENLDSPIERQRVVNETHSIPFGDDNRNNKFYRSTYKQRFGNRLCPDNNKGYRLVNASENDLIPLPSSLIYKYDGEEDYWLANPTTGHRVANNQSCILSVYDKTNNTRIIKEGQYCNGWHFYLCVKQSRKSKGKRSVLLEEDNELETTEPASNYFPDWD